jgi:hypothetical protein
MRQVLEPVFGDDYVYLFQTACYPTRDLLIFPALSGVEVSMTDLRRSKRSVSTRKLSAICLCVDSGPQII